MATDARAVRLYFETFFVPHQVFNADGTDQGLVTGYYEPLVRGARKRGGVYQTPLYRAPEDMINVDLASIYPDLKSLRLRGRLVTNKLVPYWSRAELMQNDLLAGRELVWVDDAIDAFFLQVQGSGRVYLAEGKETIRLAYAEQNGHPYKSMALPGRQGRDDAGAGIGPKHQGLVRKPPGAPAGIAQCESELRIFS